MRKILILAVLCFSLSLAVMSADGTTKKGNEKKDDQVVARIDGQPIYFSEVEKRVDNFEKKFQEINPKMKLPEEKRVNMRQDFLDRMVREKILEIAASKNNYKVTEADIDERINQLQKIFGEGPEAKQRFLSGITDMADFRANIARQIKIDKFMKEQTQAKKITVSDEDVKKYYDEKKDKFNQEESVRVSQITWRLPPKEDPEYQKKLEAARKEAQSAMMEAQSGKSFDALVESYSQDTKSKERKGDMGFVKKGQLNAELETVIFALNKGEVSKPVETELGIFLLKATDKTEARPRTFDEVKEQIKSGLEREKQGASKEQIYQELKNKMSVEVLL